MLERTGEYELRGWIDKDAKPVSANVSRFFVAGADWRQRPPKLARRLVIPNASKTATALKRLGLEVMLTKEFAPIDPATDCLVIGEESWQPQIEQGKQRIIDFIRAGGRVLCLGQLRERDGVNFDTSWLPGRVLMCQHSVNEPTYPVEDRPAYDQAHVNIERPDHPVFAGVDRNRLRYWSDYTDWDQTKPGFPRISPVRFGFKLTRQDDLGRIAVLADYDSAFEGVAIAEFFDGKG